MALVTWILPWLSHGLEKGGANVVSYLDCSAMTIPVCSSRDRMMTKTQVQKSRQQRGW